MSPSKQKSQDGLAAAIDLKVLACQTSGAGSAYNPSSGTFHTLAPLTSDSGLNSPSGRFKSIDDVDDNTRDVDCMSNNGSYSGESEDQQPTNSKDKHASGKTGTGGAEKRDKIRGKNERKHQRQKERRAQELRDKCTGYLMSRKLEGLAQKLVAMGFSQERATMALIVNDGRVEQSVAWLLEGSEVQVHEDWNTGGNPKIDISEELGQILEIEKKYNLSRPDIDRAVVACEGDLSKAIDQLRARYWSFSPGHEEDKTALDGSLREELPSTTLQGHIATQQRSDTALLQSSSPSRWEDRVEILTREGQSHNISVSSHNALEGSLTQVKGSAKDSHGLFPFSGRRGYASVVSGSIIPSYMSSKAESGMMFGFGTSDSRLIIGAPKDSTQTVQVKDSSLVGQTHVLRRTSAQPIRPSNHSVTSPALSPSSWSNGFMEEGSPSSVLYLNTPHAEMRLKTGKASIEDVDTGPSDVAGHSNSLASMQSDSRASKWTAPEKGLINDAPLLSVTHSRSPSGTAYGLFTGWGAGLSQTSVDWSTGPLSNYDYRNIDWSMNVSPTTVQGISRRLSSLMLRDTATQYWNHETDGRFQARSGAASFAELTCGQGNWKIGRSITGVQDSTSFQPSNTPAYEWTSPFAGKNLFNLSQSVSSPSL